ncbi:MAG: HEPN domain-containing protein, partial [bacterium]|nr:HEPN domain-containing protein [bacterium]
CFKDWLLKADHDLMAAEAILHYYEEPPTDMVCYHCHQVVEKVLKAYLLSRELAISRSHDLVALLNLAVLDEELLSEISEDIEELNQYYIEAKYPLDGTIVYPLEEAQEAMKKAYNVFDRIKLLMSPPSWPLL